MALTNTITPGIGNRTGQIGQRMERPTTTGGYVGQTTGYNPIGQPPQQNWGGLQQVNAPLGQAPTGGSLYGQIGQSQLPQMGGQRDPNPVQADGSRLYGTSLRSDGTTSYGMGYNPNRPPIGMTPPMGNNPAGGQFNKSPIGQTPPIMNPNLMPQQPPLVSDNNLTQPQQMQQPQMMQTNQQYGLSGASNALRGGLQGGLSQLNRGVQGGLNTLLSGYQQGQNYINQGVNALGNVQMGGAGSSNINTGQGMYQQGINGLNNFTQNGINAQNQQANLSGANGQQAFQSALMNNPATKFLQEQGQEAVLNNASAMGGLGGGNVMKELSRFNQGLAAQDLNNQFNRAGSLANQGLQAQGQIGQMYGQAGSTQAQLAGQNASNQTQASLSNANMSNNANNNMARMYGQGASMAQALAGQGAQMQYGGGQVGANMMQNSANNLSNIRSQAGRDISGQLGATSTGLANLTNAQGIQASNLIQQAGGNIQAAIQAAQNSGNTQMAAMLANIATGQGSQLSGQAQAIGNAQSQGQMNQGQIAINNGQNQQQFIGNMLGAAQYGGLFNSSNGATAPTSAISASTLGRGANLGNLFGQP